MTSHDNRAVKERPTGRLACAVATCLGLLAEGEGRAATWAPTAALEYQVDDGCPDVSHFKSVVLSRLGYDAFREDAPSHVLVRISRSRDRIIEGRIEWRDAAGT
jgi:hypothetical protein